MKTLERLGISPAPWIEKAWATSDDCGHDVADRNHRSICDMCLLQGETRIPNAHLIAASPDLYEALAAMLSCAENEAPFTKESGMSIAMDMARKAIKKAGGEE